MSDQDNGQTVMYHGRCSFPSNSGIYSGCIAGPQLGPLVRRNPGWLNREDIEAMGICFGENGADEEAWNHVWRFDVLGPIDLKDNPDYLSSLELEGLARTEFPNTSYGKVLQELRRLTGDVLKGNDRVVPFYITKTGLGSLSPALCSGDHDATLQLYLEHRDGAVCEIFKEMTEIDDVVVNEPGKI